MTEAELFDIIDEGIDNFKKNEGYQKRIKVDKRPHSDWLIFNWRQLTWNENDLDYLIEIYPNFRHCGCSDKTTRRGPVFSSTDHTNYKLSLFINMRWLVVFQSENMEWSSRSTGCNSTTLAIIIL